MSFLQREVNEHFAANKPRVVNLEDFLNLHVNNTCDKASMRLVKQDMTFNKASAKLTVVSLYCMRGSGKTQFIKYACFTLWNERLAHGRVIVRCCDRSSKNAWNILAKSAADEHGSAKALVALIMEHLENVAGYHGDTPTTSEAAYALWLKVTTDHFATGAGRSLTWRTTGAGGSDWRMTKSELRLMRRLRLFISNSFLQL